MKNVVLEFRNVSIFSNASVAIQDFTLTVYQGEYIIILGADGSGKSLIGRSLHGEVPIHHGEIRLNGVPYHPANIQQAHQEHIFLISRSGSLIDSQSIAENIFNNCGKQSPFHLVNQRFMINAAIAVLHDFGLNLDTSQSPARLPQPMKCILEMIKWYIHGAKVIILNNTLGIAGSQEYADFLHIVEEINKRGVTVLHLTNRSIQEFATASRCVLLSKEGRIARIIAQDEFSMVRINDYLSRSFQEQFVPSAPCQRGEELLRGEHISASNFSNLNFTLYAGEVLGFLCDNGTAYGQLADVLSGSCTYKGQLYLDSHPITIHNERKAVRLGIGVFFSDSRRMYFPDLSEKENVLLPFWERLSNIFGILNHHKIHALEQDAQACLDNLRAQFSPSHSENYMLSILARYILYPYRILVLPFPSAVNDAHKEKMIKHLATTIQSRGGGLIIIATRQDRLQGLGCRIVDLRCHK